MSGPNAVIARSPSSMAHDVNDFSYRYNTRLSREDEVEFSKWKRSKDVYDYDARGAWLELRRGSMSEDERGHLGDKYKKPNHPTFSNESIYHGVDGYVGCEWLKDKDGKYIAFVPGKTNTRSKKELKRYFEQHEHDIRLDDRRR